MRRNRGFTLVEVIIAIAVTATGLVAVMSLMPELTATAETSSDIATAVGLAQLLIEEIDTAPFEDPADNCTFGPEADEMESSRADFDDVDDYQGYADAPPEDRNGNPDTDYAEYSRSVEVVNLDASDLSITCPDGTTDVKRVTVTVRTQNKEVARLTVLRFYGANRSDTPLLKEKMSPLP